MPHSSQLKVCAREEPAAAAADRRGPAAPALAPENAPSLRTPPNKGGRSSTCLERFRGGSPLGSPCPCREPGLTMVRNLCDFQFCAWWWIVSCHDASRTPSFIHDIRQHVVWREVMIAHATHIILHYSTCYIIPHRIIIYFTAIVGYTTRYHLMLTYMCLMCHSNTVPRPPTQQSKPMHQVMHHTTAQQTAWHCGAMLSSNLAQYHY